MPGLFKVGFTCESVERRRRELSGATGVPEEFVVDYYQLTEDAEEAEGKIHADLSESPVTDRREFFRSELSFVIAAIRRHAREPALQFERPVAASGAGTSNQKECRSCGARSVRRLQVRSARIAVSRSYADLH